MDIDDDLIDIFEDNSEEMHTKPHTKNWVFPIIGRTSSEAENYSNGTGFFINNEGVFVTAGHVIVDKRQIYKALVNDKECDFQVIFIEYVEKELQKPPICKDLAICKIVIANDQLTDSHLKFNNLRSEPLSYCGFKQEPPQVIREKKPVYYYKYEALDEDHKGDKIDKRSNCDNTRSLIHKEGVRMNGLSGGPVYCRENIYGVLIGNEYILSIYIIEKLNQLGIQFQ